MDNVLVTGASRGIGLAIARNWRASGYCVIGRRAEPGERDHPAHGRVATRRRVRF